MRQRFLLAFLLLITMDAFAGGQITLVVQNGNPSNLFGSNPRIPVAPIFVSQIEHVFFFNTSLVGETIQIFDGTDLLYVGVIEEDGSVVIPACVTGEVELRLLRGELIYSTLTEL